MSCPLKSKPTGNDRNDGKFKTHWLILSFPAGLIFGGHGTFKNMPLDKP